MIKIHFQDDQDALFKACGGHMTRLIDFGARVKSAASEAIPKSVIERFKPDADHFLQHMIIMGDTETYGQNRNGDGWSKSANEKYHPTFVTHGAYYREHNHRSKDLSIGPIKYAAYNPEMARTELLVWGNIKKAEDIYEALKRGDGRSNSMSARVPNDRCNCCGHVAKTPEYYCKHAKHQMNQWVPEFKKYAFVWNDQPTFFDASDVAYPADRTAHYLEYRFPDGEMRKAASADGHVILGTDWAKFAGVVIPDGGRVFEGIKAAWFKKLVDEERWMRAAVQDTNAHTSNMKLAFALEVGPKLLCTELSDEEIKTARSMRPGTFFGELAKRASVLPFRTFTAYATGKSLAEVDADPAVKIAAETLPEVFTALEEDGCGCSDAPDMFDGSSPGVINIDPGKNDPVEKLMASAQDKFDVEKEPVKKRVMEESAEKEASAFSKLITRGDAIVTPEIAARGRQLAGLYGLYKVAALSDMSMHSGKQIDDLQVTLLTAHNFFAR